MTKPLSQSRSCNCFSEAGKDENGNDTFKRVPSGNCPVHGSN